ncbi:MAG: ferrochelatase [Xanthomonadales bacterium]|nr:ferrochelatase [Xanthomonadales bacterium]
MPIESTRALILVNLGTPAAPTAAAVRRYLSEFLLDPRVVQIPRLLWWPLLNWVILPRRSPVVARKYAAIWMDEGSPLAAYTQRLANGMQAALPGWRVAMAMRYGEPALAKTIDALVADDVNEIVVLPLYPQYSTTTTASVEDVVAESRAKHPRVAFRTVHDYHVDPHWVAATAASIREHWTRNGRAGKLLFSFHGIPERLVRNGDPYAAQCEASTVAVAAALGMARADILLTYQSRFGRERWLQPYTLPTLQQLARDGVRDIDVACPGFAVDCLETLEEIAMLNAEAFVAAGGRALRYIPCLNDGAAHVQALATIAESAA